MKDGAASRDRIEDLRFTKAKASKKKSAAKAKRKTGSGTTVPGRWCGCCGHAWSDTLDRCGTCFAKVLLVVGQAVPR